MKTQQQIRAGKQSGFTLIELMIVVTIIGVLASIAVPVYRDYTIRTRVSEAASIFAPVKADIALFWSENGTLPVDLLSMPRIPNNFRSFEGEYVATLLVINGETTVTLKNDPRLGDAGGGNVVFTPDTSSGGTIRWSVTGQFIPIKYLPRP